MERRSDTLAWKYPSEELGTWTQMIVAESQKAFLFKSGQPVGPFLAGRHTLDTANYPILGQILKIATGGRSPFTAEVWYVNKVISLDIKWGTPTAIRPSIRSIASCSRCAPTVSSACRSSIPANSS